MALYTLLDPSDEILTVECTSTISSEMERIYLTLIILDLYILRCLIFMKYTLEYIVC